MSIVLSIGTTHPWNTAGVGLDALLAHRLGVHVDTVVVAVSAQDASGLRALASIPVDVVRAQLDALPRDRANAIRIGALTSPEIVAVVAEAVRARNDVPVVVDPVLGPSAGGRFANDATMEAIATELASLRNVILTPNLVEASRLLGGRSIDRENIADAADQLRRLGARAVLLKGGHLAGSPIDALATEAGVERFSDTRLPGEMRGTGCTLAIALAARLAHGDDLRAAVQNARAFVRQRIREA